MRSAYHGCPVSSLCNLAAKVEASCVNTTPSCVYGSQMWASIRTQCRTLLLLRSIIWSQANPSTLWLLWAQTDSEVTVYYTEGWGEGGHISPKQPGLELSTSGPKPPTAFWGAWKEEMKSSAPFQVSNQQPPCSHIISAAGCRVRKTRLIRINL